MVSPSIALLSLLLIALLGAGVIVVIKVRREQARKRPVIRIRHVLGPIFIVAAVVAIGVTPLASLSFDLSYEVSGTPPSSSDAIPTGESATQTIEVPIEPLPAIKYVVRGSGVSVNSWQRQDSTMFVSVTIPASQNPGTYSSTLRLTPYPAILPTSLLEDLHDLSPLAAMLGSAVALLAPPYILSRLLLDGDRPIFRTRNRWLWRRLGDRP